MHSLHESQEVINHDLLFADINGLRLKEGGIEDEDILSHQSSLYHDEKTNYHSICVNIVDEALGTDVNAHVRTSIVHTLGHTISLKTMIWIKPYGVKEGSTIHNYDVKDVSDHVIAATDQTDQDYQLILDDMHKFATEKAKELLIAFREAQIAEISDISSGELIPNYFRPYYICKLYMQLEERNYVDELTHEEYLQGLRELPGIHTDSESNIGIFITSPDNTDEIAITSNRAVVKVGDKVFIIKSESYPITFIEATINKINVTDGTMLVERTDGILTNVNSISTISLN